jgi:hypothetical protein
MIADVPMLLAASNRSNAVGPASARATASAKAIKTLGVDNHIAAQPVRSDDAADQHHVVPIHDAVQSRDLSLTDVSLRNVSP